MMVKALPQRKIKSFLKKHSEWGTNSKNTQIHRTFLFDSHIDGLVFIARISVHAQVQKHHPDIEFSYRKVKVKLKTHEIKALSQADIRLASKIDTLV